MWGLNIQVRRVPELKGKPSAAPERLSQHKGGENFNPQIIWKMGKYHITNFFVDIIHQLIQFSLTHCQIFHNIILELWCRWMLKLISIEKKIERKCKFDGGAVNAIGRSCNQDAGGALQDALKLILNPVAQKKHFLNRKRDLHGTSMIFQ